MKYTIDRITSNIAVLEGYDGSRMELPVSRLPNGAKEGSAVEINDRKISLFIDNERTKKIADLMKKVWK